MADMKADMILEKKLRILHPNPKAGRKRLYFQGPNRRVYSALGRTSKMATKVMHNLIAQFKVHNKKKANEQL